MKYSITAFKSIISLENITPYVKQKNILNAKFQNFTINRKS
jgi:hypothetical protein